jgi:hypothetical protein
LETLCGMCWFWIHAHTSLFIVLCCRGIMKLKAESFIMQQVLVFFADMNCSGFCDLLLFSDAGLELCQILFHMTFFSFCLLLLCQIR